MSNTVYGIIVNEGYFSDHNFVITVQRKGKTDKATAHSFDSFSRPLVRKNLDVIQKTIEDIIRFKEGGAKTRKLYRIAEFAESADKKLTYVTSHEPKQPKCYRIKSSNVDLPYVSTFYVNENKSIRDISLTDSKDIAVSWTNPNTVMRLIKQFSSLHPELKFSAEYFYFD